MIIEALFNLLFGLVKLIFSLIPPLPGLDENALTSLHEALDTIFNNANLLGFFFPIDLAKMLLEIVIIILTAYETYKLALWVITWVKSHK